MNDTPPEIAALSRARMAERSGAERFRMGVEMFEVARRTRGVELDDPAGLETSMDEG